MVKKFMIIFVVLAVLFSSGATSVFAGSCSSGKSAGGDVKAGTVKAVNATGNVIYDSVKGVGSAAETVGKAAVDTVEATGNALTGHSSDKTRD